MNQQTVVETFFPLEEKDPNGISQHAPGAKLDHGKNRLGLVLGGFPRALQAVGKVGTFGASKYTDNGWLSVERGQERYTDALLRHVFRDFEGERLDPDSGIEHAAHAAWNALARLELMLRADLNGVEPVEWPESEARMDVIGQNGPDGAPYADLANRS